MQRTEGSSSDADNIGIKRDRFDSDDSSGDSLDSKRVRFDSDIQAHDSLVPDPRVKDESNSEDILREDFLDILEEEVDIEPEIQGLESVIRSLEEEIHPFPPADLMKESQETLVLNEPDRIELGYLLEASDDELGLPPTRFISDDAGSEIDPSPINSQMADLSGILASDDEISRFNDSIGHEFAGGENRARDFWTVDGLFDYGVRVDASDLPELKWRPESMPAL